MSNRHKGEQIRSGLGHYRSLLTHGHVRQHTHAIRRNRAEMIVILDPTIYRKHIWYNRHSKPMLYVQLKNALYGTLQAALLFWKLLSETLQEWGFTLSPYGKCSKQTYRGKAV